MSVDAFFNPLNVTYYLNGLLKYSELFYKEKEKLSAMDFQKQQRGIDIPENTPPRRL